jgi:hypothetical protein
LAGLLVLHEYLRLALNRHRSARPEETFLRSRCDSDVCRRRMQIFTTVDNGKVTDRAEIKVFLFLSLDGYLQFEEKNTGLQYSFCFIESFTSVYIFVHLNFCSMAVEWHGIHFNFSDGKVCTMQIA